MTHPISAVVQVIKATNRIPDAYKPSFTFFAESDRWVYHAKFDEKQCNDCNAFSIYPVYMGHQIRTLFPWLQIVSPNLIEVMVHPNCRCHLHRMTKDYVPTHITYEMKR